MNDSDYTLTGQLTKVAAEAANQTAIIFRQGEEVREYSFGRLYRESLAAARWLKARG